MSPNIPETPVETHFAPAARASAAELQQALAAVSQNPVIDTVLHTTSGLLAVLNEQRQILVVNDSLLELLNITTPDDALGLRPGEALQCIHAHEHPGGCGTSQACCTCGAVIAILASLESGHPEQQTCVATVNKHDEHLDLYLQVRCTPITFAGQRLLLLLLQDITLDQQRAALERVFFHDIVNLINSLMMNSEMLEMEPDVPQTRAAAHRILQASTRLAQEVQIQKALSAAEPHAYQLHPRSVSTAQALQEIADLFVLHPVAQGKTLELPVPAPNLPIFTDASLLQRILTNMVVNAFEATAAGGTVKLWLEAIAPQVTFCVWNASAIPPAVVPRIFQRNFSTKTGAGRGLGTYSMKLFGETYLRGKVSFSTSEATGTSFRLSLPQAGA